MREAIISTREVRARPDNLAVEVVAILDAGEIVPGMFVHIPLNGMLSFTVRVTDVIPIGPARIRLELDCGGDSTGATLVTALNFENETLRVLETGEP